MMTDIFDGLAKHINVDSGYKHIEEWINDDGLSCQSPYVSYSRGGNFDTITLDGSFDVDQIIELGKYLEMEKARKEVAELEAKLNIEITNEILNIANSEGILTTSNITDIIKVMRDALKRKDND